MGLHAVPGLFDLEPGERWACARCGSEPDEELLDAAFNHRDELWEYANTDGMFVPDREPGDLRSWPCAECDTAAAWIVRRHQPIPLAERWPAGVIERGFVPLPTLILEHRELLGLSTLDLAVLLALEAHRRADGSVPVWPAQDRLSELSGLKERALRNHLASLERRGFIEREKRARRSGQRASDRYTRLGLDRLLAVLQANISLGRNADTGLGLELRRLAEPPASSAGSPPASRAGEVKAVLEVDPLRRAAVRKRAAGGGDVQENNGSHEGRAA